jgi:hypothetical protein
MGDPAPNTAPLILKGSMRGKGRWILVLIFFLFLAILIFLPSPNRRTSSKAFHLVLKGGVAVSERSVAFWIGPDPISRMGSNETIRLWVLHHPWVRTAALVRQPWGGGSVIVDLQKPEAILRPPTIFSPGQPSFPWGQPKILPYLLPSGKVVTGLSVSRFRSLPEVILQTPLKLGDGERVLKTIRRERKCQDHGAPEGKTFVFLGKHEIRMLPDHASYYLVLPEGKSCDPFRMLARFFKTHPMDPGGHLNVGEGGAVLGIDLRFSKMILLRQRVEEKALSGKHAPRKKL